jgi:hypothetical protein
MKKTWIMIYDLLNKDTEYSIPILPTFGNNDLIVHSTANSPELKKKYYPEMFKIWFLN